MAVIVATIAPLFKIYPFVCLCEIFMKIVEEQKLDFSDVLIRPCYSDMSSRKEANIYRRFEFLNSSNVWEGFPLISANMDSVSTYEMAKALNVERCMTAVHKHYSVEDIVRFYREQPDVALVNSFYTLGISAEDIQKYKDVKNELGYALPFVCMDVANGYMQKFLDTIKMFKDKNPDSVIMAGNVVTPEGAEKIIEAGASIVKLGIGQGCFVGGTRILMANGSYKNIEDVKLHDKVINQRGQPVEVIGTKFSGFRKVKKYRNNLFHSYSYATGDHKHWVGDLSTSKSFAQEEGIVKFLSKATRSKESKFMWKSLDEYHSNFVCLLPEKMHFNLPDTFNYDMEQHFLAQRRYDETRTIINKNIKASYGLGFLIGSFLGDGTAHIFQSKNRQREGITDKNDRSLRANMSAHLTWYYGLNEQALAETTQKYLLEVFNCNSTLKYTENMVTVVVRSNPLARFFFQFGKKKEKYLPDELRCSNKSYLTGMYDGMIASDGHYANDGREGFDNTGTQLIELFMFLAKEVNGYYPSISRKEPSLGGLVGGNIENCSVSYCARTVKHPEWLVVNGYQINRINEIEDHDVIVPTYDIEVDCDTHSFIANNMIVHNSACRTRVVAGVGVPQLSTILDTADAVHNLGAYLCSDGGCSKPADVAKALGAGADFVMLGGMLAGHTESGGEVFTDEHGKKKMFFYGMSSETAMKKHNGGMASHRSSEGRTVAIDYRGDVAHTIQDIAGGVRSAMTYTNSHNLEEFAENVVFIKIRNELNLSLAQNTIGN